MGVIVCFHVLINCLSGKYSFDMMTHIQSVSILFTRMCIFAFYCLAAQMYFWFVFLCYFMYLYKI